MDISGHPGVGISLAKEGGHTEIVDLPRKHGAKE